FIILLPMAFPGGIRIQELYIEGEGRKERDEGPVKTRRCVLILNLDVLGELMVEITMTDRKLSCRIACRHEEAHQTIMNHLDDLRDRFAVTGLAAEAMVCTLDPRLGEVTKDFRAGLYINRREAMSLFA
ncbi:MAG: flagellar hook-length control protein FliK, partial [Syntrophales bacterium]|nr:flagellar hook-length control protein FliK [Syntrophales bacterium]